MATREQNKQLVDHPEPRPPSLPALPPPLPGLQHVQAALRGPPIPGQLLPPLPLDQLVVQDDGLLLAQQLQGLLVLLGQLLGGGGGRPSGFRGTALRGLAQEAGPAPPPRPALPHRPPQASCPPGSWPVPLSVPDSSGCGPPRPEERDAHPTHHAVLLQRLGLALQPGLQGHLLLLQGCLPAQTLLRVQLGQLGKLSCRRDRTPWP